MKAPQRSTPRPGARPAGASPASLSDAELAELQELLDAVPAPLEPLDVSALDGFLCGVIVQPVLVAKPRWLPFVTDVEAKPLPAGHDARRLRALVLRRESELHRSIERRQWFDPWVFELEPEEGSGSEPEAGAQVDAVVPWVAGFATALETFTRLLEQGGAALTEPLAAMYRHIDAAGLDDADELRSEIASLEPLADLAEAVEELVRATLLLADAAGLPTRR